ncbi:hypothetical protein [Laspinema olomoucense]|uniref:hypothetical protein n=1 Tax=Laspinema olomoucense TaxID=3231600 RepID=UPI0021BA8804|nr:MULTISPECIES: hypothetical protein [unclassified Laspinema]MCT7987199.1 hypothetical protein [Laspinema sp. D3a]MCT7992233.1 hypothetical protein [Laspinema sp. D3c]
MKINQLSRGLSLVCLMGLIGCTQQTTGRICEYTPAAGQPNPLGEKASFRIREQEGNTIFTYQPDPSEMLEETIELSGRRELTYRNTDLDTARVKLIQNPEHYKRLIDKKTPQDFAAVNESLTCQ